MAAGRGRGLLPFRWIGASAGRDRAERRETWISFGYTSMTGSRSSSMSGGRSLLLDNRAGRGGYTRSVFPSYVHLQGLAIVRLK